MPAPAVRARYRDLCEKEGKFSPRSLVYLARSFYVAPEAMVGAWNNCMAERTFNEVLRDPSGRMPASAQRRALVDQGLIALVPLDQEGNEPA